MSATMKDLGLDTLSADERTALGYELLESVEVKIETSSFLTDAKRAELDRLRDVVAGNFFQAAQVGNAEAVVFRFVIQNVCPPR